MSRDTRKARIELTYIENVSLLMGFLRLSLSEHTIEVNKDSSHRFLVLLDASGPIVRQQRLDYFTNHDTG